MYYSVDDYAQFYKSEIGLKVQAVLDAHIQALWPDCHDLRVMGCGYASPYLGSFVSQKTERVIAMIPDYMGVKHWPEGRKNLALCAEEGRFPIENASLDRIVCVHYLEGCADYRTALREVWRVLKANGRVLMIVPNRMGMWSRSDVSPFGIGQPFTHMQLCELLREHLFVEQSHVSALFMPPIPDSPVIMRSSNLIERMAGRFLPFVAGVHMAEFSKQIYARADDNGSGSAVFEKTKKILKPAGTPIPQNREFLKDFLDQHHP